MLTTPHASRPCTLRRSLARIKAVRDTDSVSPNTSATHWTYGEEDFGGSVARMSASRGGVQSATAVGNQVL